MSTGPSIDKPGPDLDPIVSPVQVAEKLGWATECPPGSDVPTSIQPLLEELEPAWEQFFPEGFDRAFDDWNKLEELCKQVVEKKEFLQIDHLPRRWQARAFLCVTSRKNQQLLKRSGRNTIQVDEEATLKRKREADSFPAQRSPIRIRRSTSEIDLETETDAYLATADDTLAQFQSLQQRLQRGDDLVRKRQKRHLDDQKRAKLHATTSRARLNELIEQVEEKDKHIHDLEADHAAKNTTIRNLQGDNDKLKEDLKKQQERESEEAVKSHTEIASLGVKIQRMEKVDEENQQLRKDIANIKQQQAHDAAFRQRNRVLEDNAEAAKTTIAIQKTTIGSLQKDIQTLEKERAAQHAAHKKAFEARTKSLRAEQAKRKELESEVAARAKALRAKESDCERLDLKYEELQSKSKDLESELQQKQAALEAISQVLKTTGPKSPTTGLRTPASRTKSR